MGSELFALTIDATRPERQARFWSEVLGRARTDEVTVPAPDGTGFRLRFVPTGTPKTGPNWAHFDLTSQSRDEQEQTVARALRLGGRHLDIGQLPEEEHVVLADPEGNEFCVIEPGNDFLAGCGLIGALSCEGGPEVGYFWSAALGWPLVWDQDQETAIQSPRGGSKITWGGPPDVAKSGPNRLRFALRAVDADQRAEVERLLTLGATRLGEDPAGGLLLADPGGNEFSVLPPR